MMKKVLSSGILMLLFTFLIISCDEEPVNPPDDNNPPVANAGDDVTVSSGSTVTMDGSNSTDPDEDELSYQWSIVSAPSGSTATITNATEAIATFVPDVPGSYTLRLTVDDGNNATHIDDVIILAEEETGQTIEISSDINEDQVWENIFSDPAIPDYRVTNRIRVNARLTINPGVRVEVNEGRIITVESDGGTLVAEGEEGSPIVFTSPDEDGEIRWGGILINSSSTQNSLDHVDLRFGGGETLIDINGWRGAALALNRDARVSITNSNFTRSGGDGLIVRGMGNLIAFENNTFSANNNSPITISINQLGVISASNILEDDQNTAIKENVVRVFDSMLDQPQEWSPLSNGASYRFVQKVVVRADLTINEGTILEFEERVVMEVSPEGVLKALGTADEPVVFTSHDIANGKKWGGIIVRSSSVNNELDHVQVLHAGGEDGLVDVNGWKGANIALANKAKLKLTNSEVAHSADYGLIIHPEAVLEDFEGNNFHDNTDYPILTGANMVGMLDEATEISGNGDDAVVIISSIFNTDARFREGSDEKWVALNGDARYLINGDLTISHDLAIAEGAYLAFGDGVRMNIAADGSLTAVGAADNQITFTANEQDGNHNWGGIIIRSSDSKNQIQNAEISFGGNYSSLIDVHGWKGANIAVGNNASLEISSTQVSDSKAYGIIVHPSSQTTLGSDMTYSNNAMDDEYKGD